MVHGAISNRITFFLALGVFAFASVSARAKDTKGKLSQSVSTGTAAPMAPTTPGAPGPDWRKETEATCGMSCRYHRANDNLTMQALYLVTKIGKIDAAIKADSSSTDARTALGAFCKTTTEDLKDCFDRYKDFQHVGLLEIRQAIGKNEDSIARLTTGRKADGTVEDGTALAFDSGQTAVPYMPDVPTLSELEQSYLDGKLKPAGTAYSRDEIQKWSQTLVVNDPKAKYIQFSGKAAVGNPYQQEQTSYSVYMENRDESGTSAGADPRALKAYNNAQKRIQDFAKDKTIDDGKIKVIAPSKNLKKEDAISYDALVQTRSQINQKIETDVHRSDQDEQERKLASVKDPDVKPSPGPSGSPVETGRNISVSRDVNIAIGGTATQKPAAMKTYAPDETVVRPPDMKNSRYIKYDLGDMMNDIENH